MGELFIISDDVVYVLSAYDPDGKDILNYTLSGPDVGKFRIDPRGIITATQELLEKDYSITATVYDHGNLSSSVGLGFYISEAVRHPVFEVVIRRFIKILMQLSRVNLLL